MTNEELIREQYNNYGDKYIQESSRYYQAYHRVRVSGAANYIRSFIKRGSIFDFGCGTGELFSEFDSADYVYTGSDVSDEMVRIAQKRTGCTIYRWGLDDYIQNTPEADCIIALNVLPYLSEEDEERFLKETFEKLDKGGILYLSHTNALFDAITANRYTTEFLKENFQFILNKIGVNVDKYFEKFLTKPDFPSAYGYTGLQNNISEREIIEKRRVDPFTYPDYLRELGFEVKMHRSLNLYPLPPFLMTEDEDISIKQTGLADMFPENSVKKLYSSQFQIAAHRPC